MCFTVVSAAGYTYTIGDNEYYDLPINHIDEYPATPDGYLSFFYDTATVVSNNYYQYKGWSDAWENWNDVSTYFLGDDTPLQFNLPDPRSVLSDYYLNGGGSTEGKSQTHWTDGHGGYFYIEEFPNGSSGGAYNDAAVYYKPSSGHAERLGSWGWYGAQNYSFTVDRYDGQRVYYTVSASNKNGGSFSDSWYFDCPYDVTMTEQPVSMPVGGVCHGLRGHIRRDPDGKLYFVDDDGNEYPFNPDGTVHFPDGDYPFDIDPDTLQDDNKRDIDNNIDLYNLYLLNTLRNISNDGNGSGCKCPDYSSYLLNIASHLNSIDSKNSSIISLLKKIEKNTRGNDNNIFDNTVMDLVLPDDETFQFELISDAIMKKLDFSDYFTQLNNLLHIAMGSDYVASDDYKDYFKLDKYFNENNNSLKLSTRDAKVLYGNDLAKSDIDVTSSDYLSATALARGSASEKNRSSISANLVVPPAVYITWDGNMYNLFEWIDTDTYDYIRPLKEFIRIIIYIGWLFWVVKFLPSVISNAAYTWYNQVNSW